VVTLSQPIVKSIIMDVVVDNLPANYGMLLSILWERKLGGNMQMEMKYATVPVFGGEKRRIYRETKFAYVVSDQNNPVNHPIYEIKIDLGYCILSIDGITELESIPTYDDLKLEGVWKLYFDGACSKDGSKARIEMISN
jgi:hypothetical protein